MALRARVKENKVTNIFVDDTNSVEAVLIPTEKLNNSGVILLENAIKIGNDDENYTIVFTSKRAAKTAFDEICKKYDKPDS